MILLLIKSYLTLFITISIGSLLLFMAGMFLILKLFKTSRQVSSHPTNIKTSNNRSHITASDIRAIAGEDELSTQLDLARAYIDVGKKQLAKTMLDHILRQGSDIQQREARELIGLLKL